MNPVLKTKTFIPDVEAHVMPDGRLYVYGSLDNTGDTEYCSTAYRTYSTTDMIHWQDHGEIFNSIDAQYGYQTQLTVGGPDCLYINGKYYLYYCAAGNGMGVAVAEHPYGPFRQLGPVTPADGDSIDPAIFQDDDGQVYYFWGQFNLRGGKLADDMCTVIPESINRNILSEHEHGFHEGASIRKINGIYYMVYADISRGKPTCLAYATASAPMGPYQKRGVIIDNIGSDPHVWNNHGSIAVFHGQAYVFYHRSSQGDIYNRRFCIEPITINADGHITEVKMTSNGVSDKVASDEIQMSQLSRMRIPLDDHKPMALYPSDELEALNYVKDGDWVQFDNVDFKSGMMHFSVEVASPKPMTIELWQEDNRCIGSCLASGCQSLKDYQFFEGDLTNTSGIHTVWLIFKSAQHSVGRLGNVRRLRIK